MNGLGGIGTPARGRVPRTSSVPRTAWTTRTHHVGRDESSVSFTSSKLAAGTPFNRMLPALRPIYAAPEGWRALSSVLNLANSAPMSLWLVSSLANCSIRLGDPLGELLSPLAEFLYALRKAALPILLDGVDARSKMAAPVPQLMDQCLYAALIVIERNETGLKHADLVLQLQDRLQRTFDLTRIGSWSRR